MTYESPLTIADVVKDISANKYVLPSIQREFVWSTSQIEKLFDSVMQDYSSGNKGSQNCRKNIWLIRSQDRVPASRG